MIPDGNPQTFLSVESGIYAAVSEAISGDRLQCFMHAKLLSRGSFSESGENTVQPDNVVSSGQNAALFLPLAFPRNRRPQLFEKTRVFRNPRFSEGMRIVCSGAPPTRNSSAPNV